ncbi:restriction endonuclease subunit S [Corynebacterium argentoratense]|uniref:restriction endonuclease subunit S n=1 Tax=Corynebacterium argentoratense TaxID=42817 RepID=UPI0028D12F9A|nr:restriction endonuclease subunit S [Corynebacterium argentoratense]
MSTIKPDWLPSLKSGWLLTPLKYLCTIETGTADTQDAEPTGVFDFVIRSPHLKRATSFTFDCEAIVTAGDGAVGEVFHHLNGKFLAHQRTYVLHDFKEINVRYLFYYFSSYFRFMCQDGSAKTTVDSVRRWMLTDMPVVIPPVNEQERIAKHLDVETARIDHLIAKQRELLKLLDLRNEARWHEAFTGFTPLKTLPLKRLLVKQYRPVVEGAGVVTAFRDGEVTLRSNRREEGFTFSETEAGYQGVVAGDLVFHGLDGFAGAVGISDSNGQSTPVYHVCRLRNDDDNLRFIAYLLRYLGNSGFLATQAPSVRQRAVDFRNWQTFGRIPLSLPQGKVQQRIVSELDESAKALADARATIERALGLLQERRSALITAVVTGQVEV